MARESYFYFEAQKEVIHLTILYTPVGCKILQVPPWLWERCEYTSANMLNKEYISSETIHHSVCWRGPHVWANLNEWPKSPSSQQNSSKSSRVIQIMFLRHLVAKRLLSLDDVFVHFMQSTSQFCQCSVSFYMTSSPSRLLA